MYAHAYNSSTEIDRGLFFILHVKLIFAIA